MLGTMGGSGPDMNVVIEYFLRKHFKNFLPVGITAESLRRRCRRASTTNKPNKCLVVKISKISARRRTLGLSYDGRWLQKEPSNDLGPASLRPPSKFEL